MKDPHKRKFEESFRPSNKTFREKYGYEKGVHVEPIREDERNQRIIMNIGIDVSGSTQELWGDMTECFNGIMMRSFRQVVKEYRKVLRVGAVVFSEKIVPIWDGFQDIETITGSNGKKLTESIIRQAQNGKTALYRTMIECLKHSATAAEHLNASKMPGNPAKIKICILTDGANNMDPLNAEEVREMTNLITDRKQIRLVLAYFKTKDGLSFDEFQSMTKATGFSDEPYYFDASKGTRVERATAFRHFFEIISDRSSRNIAFG